MKTTLLLMTISLFLIGCNTTRSLQCPFTADQTRSAELLTNLAGEWELYSVNDNRDPDTLIGQVIFTPAGTGPEASITAQITIDDKGRLVKHPSCMIRGADINGETFLAVGLDLKTLAKQAGFDEPGTLATPLFLLLRLKRYDNSSLIAEAVTFAQAQNETWTPLDKTLQITKEGIVTSPADIQNRMLTQKKFTLQGAMYLQPKP